MKTTEELAIRVVANRQLHGVYGTKLQNEEFYVSSSLANVLLEGGMVRKVTPFKDEVSAIQTSIRSSRCGDTRK